MKLLWEILLKFPINWIIAHPAYWFRKSAQKSENWLWLFLSDDNMYGDKTWRPNLKNKYWRAILWMYRNPLVNRHFKGVVDGKESNFNGQAKIKFGNNVTAWRRIHCSDTGDWHGKILDFKKSLFGYQDITFIRTNEQGSVQQCFRKSRCTPHKFLWWIVVLKSRKGHENGLMIYGLGLPFYSYKKHKEGWQLWKDAEYYYQLIN